MDITKEIKDKVLESAKDIFREYSINMADYYGQIYPIAESPENNLIEVDVVFNHYTTEKALKIESLVFNVLDGKILQYSNKKLV